MKNAKYILCGDLHLRGDQPICRTDNYFKAQEAKLNFIIDLANENECPILCSGDIFHKAKSEKSLEIFLMNCLSRLKFDFLTIPGNHDLPNHRLDKLNESSLGIMSGAGLISILEIELEKIFKFDSLGIIHKLIHGDTPVMAGAEAISYSASKLMKDNKDCNLILSGDNHQIFVVNKSGEQLLVNPGSMMRMTAAQEDHIPSVFIYFDDHSVEQIFLPHDKGVIDRSHIDKADEYDERLDSFVSSVNSDYEISLNFEKNLEAYFKINETRKPVIDICWQNVKEN